MCRVISGKRQPSSSVWLFLMLMLGSSGRWWPHQEAPVTGGASAFNLDPRIPVVKSGATGSYFGYSVAQHRTLTSTKHGKSVILVGAPKDQNLQPNTTRSGALWLCSISPDPKVRRERTKLKIVRRIRIFVEENCGLEFWEKILQFVTNLSKFPHKREYILMKFGLLPQKSSKIPDFVSFLTTSFLTQIP